MELRRTMWAGGEGCLSEAGSKLCGFTVNNTGLYFKKSYTCDNSEVILYSSDSRRDKSKESCHCAVFKTEDYLANSQLSNSFFLSPCRLVFLFLSSDSCHSIHTMDQDYGDGPDYLSHIPADGERADEFEYEVNITQVNKV